MNHKIKKLIELRTNHRKVELEFEKKVKELFPIYSEIKWYKNGIQFGTVINHCGFEGDMYVRNANTGSRYRITTYDVAQAYEE